MSDRHRLEPGQSRTFTTRPVGLNTFLSLRGGEGESKAVWKVELCCKPENNVTLEAEEPRRIDISAAAGALVTVRNAGFYAIEAWTDYV